MTRKTHTTRLAELEARDEARNKNEQAVAALLDRVEARVRALETTVATHAQEQRRQESQLARLAELSGDVVRLQEQMVSSASSTRDHVARLAGQLESLSEKSGEGHAQRLTRLETLAEEHLSRARRAGIEAGVGAGGLAGSAAWLVGEIFKSGG